MLIAAALHAAWNAVIKPARDRAALLAAMSLASAAICLPVALLAPAPRAAAWPELATSALIHLAYELFLIATYRDGDFGQVYPIARGTAPPTVALCSLIVVGEHLGALQLGGLALISAGLFTLAAGRRHGSPRAIALAGATGLTIAAYTVVDGIGVRHSGAPLGYAAWLFCALGMLATIVLSVARPALRSRATLAQARPGLSIAALSIAAYGLVLWAQTHGALAVVAGLRETSVVFAALIGATLFGEPLARRRVLASAAVAAGAAALALG